VAFLCPKFSFYTFIDTGIFLMNSHTQIQNTLNNPPLQPYSPNLNPTTKTHRLNRLKSNSNKRDRPNTQPRKTKTPVAKRLANTKQMNYQQWLEVRKQGIGSSDAATACGLNPYMSMLELWMIKTGRMQQNIEDESAGYAPLYWGKQLEPLVAEYYSMHTNNKVRRVNAVLQHLMKTNTLCWQIWIMPWWVMMKFRFWNVKRWGIWLKTMARWCAFICAVSGASIGSDRQTGSTYLCLDLWA
jgi:hypothetical protein